jgi:hypothetical protein
MALASGDETLSVAMFAVMARKLSEHICIALADWECGPNQIVAPRESSDGKP